MLSAEDPDAGRQRSESQSQVPWPYAAAFAALPTPPADLVVLTVRVPPIPQKSKSVNILMASSGSTYIPYRSYSNKRGILMYNKWLVSPISSESAHEFSLPKYFLRRANARILTIFSIPSSSGGSVGWASSVGFGGVHTQCLQKISDC